MTLFAKCTRFFLATVAIGCFVGCQPAESASDEKASVDATEKTLDIDVPGVDVEISRDEEGGKVDVQVGEGS